MASANFVAGGNILPSSIVVISGTNTVSQASGVSTPMIGVSQEFLGGVPVDGASQYAAIAGDEVMVYGETDVCMLQSSTAGWTANDLLTSNGSGQGITASTGNQVVARALTTVVASALGKVQVLVGKA